MKGAHTVAPTTLSSTSCRLKSNSARFLRRQIAYQCRDPPSVICHIVAPLQMRLEDLHDKIQHGCVVHVPTRLCIEERDQTSHVDGNGRKAGAAGSNETAQFGQKRTADRAGGMGCLLPEAERNDLPKDAGAPMGESTGRSGRVTLQKSGFT